MGDYHYDSSGAMPSYLFVSSLPRTSIESIEIMSYNNKSQEAGLKGN